MGILISKERKQVVEHLSSYDKFKFALIRMERAYSLLKNDETKLAAKGYFVLCGYDYEIDFASSETAEFFPKTNDLEEMNRHAMCLSLIDELYNIVKESECSEDEKEKMFKEMDMFYNRTTEVYGAKEITEGDDYGFFNGTH